MTRATAWPSNEIGLDIHARLIAGDPVATSELAERYLDPLAEWMIRSNPAADDHDCEEAAMDAIMSLLKNPRSFKPDKLPLDSYLRMSAKGDLRNRLERERRHSDRRADLEHVELYGEGRNGEQVGEDPATIVDRQEADKSTLEAMAASMMNRVSAEEAGVLELMIQGERKTAAYAVVLGITDQSELEQRREVKRVKDRIKRRLQRARGTS